MTDFLGLMKQAAELKSKMEAMQAELDQIEVEGTSGGGLVTVKLSGKGEMKGVKIDESLIKPQEKETVEDLIVAAHADARRKAEVLLQEKMKNVAGGLPLPPGMKLFLSPVSTATAGTEIERLIQLLARLPGLGPRSARRAALFLIKKREQIMTPLAAAMQTALEKIEICRTCGNIDHHDDAGIAPRIGAHRARVLGVDVSAGATDRDFLECLLHGRGERRHDLLALL